MALCTIEIKDEVNVRLHGVDDNTMRTVVRALTFHVPNYMFMQSVRMGRWDGTVKLCKATGTTYLNLLPKILPIIEKEGYTFAIIDDRRPWKLEIPVIGSDFFAGLSSGRFEGVLEGHQVDAINHITAAGKGILELATAAGKTVITAALAKLYNVHGRVMVIVPRIDLALETQVVMKDLKIPSGIVFGEVKDLQRITVTTWQSLANMPEAFHEVVAVVCDECHEAKAKELQTILTKAGKNVPVRIGMTGTMPDVDLYRDSIVAALGPVVFSKPAWELQQEGFLAYCHVYIHKFRDSKNPAYRRAEWNMERNKDVLDWQANDPLRIAYVGAMLDEIASTGNTLMLVRFIDYGNAVVREVPDATFLHGKDDSDTRIQTYREVNADDERKLIATYGIASTGINIPRLFNLVLVEPGRDPIGLIQSIGRGLRRADDKDHVNIHLIMSDAKMVKNHIADVVRTLKRSKYPFEIHEINYYDDFVGSEQVG